MLAVAAVFVCLGTFLAIIPTGDIVRTRLVAEVRQRTGRDLVIGGPAKLTFVPSFGFSASNVTLSAPKHIGGPPLLTAESIEISISAIPLIMHEVQVDKLVLQRPRIAMRVDANGRRNWDFADAREEELRHGAVRYAQAPSMRDENGRRLPAELESFARNATTPVTTNRRRLNGINLADVQIVDGTIDYADARAGTAYELSRVNARVTAPDTAGPVEVTSDLIAGREHLAVVAKVASLADLLEDRPSKVSISVRGKPIDATYDGLLTPGAMIAADGRISVKAASAVTLARLAGLEANGIESLPVALEAQIKAQPTGVSITSATFGLGEMSGQGRIAVDIASGRPQVNASLKVSALDLDRISALELRAAAKAVKTESPSRGAASPAGTPAKSIEELIERSATDGEPPKRAPAVRGFLHRNGEDWSQEPIDSNLLRSIDFDGRLELDGLIWRQVRLGPSQSTVTLKGGVLKAHVSDAQLYGGRAKGLVNVDARQPMLVVGANISTDGVAALPLLRDWAGVSSIDGRSRIVIAVSATGGSERELISTLAGRAESHITEGAVIGWDTGDILGNLTRGRVPNFERNPNARTPFSELAATFVIAQGVARSQDLRLRSASVEASGGGLVNIVDRNVDLTVRPKAVGTSGLAGIEVPVRIAGPWGEARAVPDLNAALKSPQAQEKVRQISKQIQEGDVDGALKSVIGDDPKAQEKVKKAKDVIKQLFGKQKEPKEAKPEQQ